MLYYVNNENLYSSNERIIKKDKDKDNWEESKLEREKTWNNIEISCSITCSLLG